MTDNNPEILQTTTFFYERRRALLSGVLETATTTFLLLIAVSAFGASSTSKALIVSGASAGFLLSPLVVSITERLQFPVSKMAGILAALGAVCFALVAVFPSLPVFICFSVCGVAFATSAIPLFTQMYQENFQPTVRGRLFSQLTILRILAAGTFSALAGYLLNDRLDYFPLLLLAYSLCLAASSVCLWKCPSSPLTRSGRGGVLAGFSYLKTDKLFRNTSIAWMLMGFGNLMMIPLRVEYLANPVYGLSLSTFEVALLVSVIPNVARIVLSTMWGRLFDRLSFFSLRLVANFGFLIGILAFFCSDNIPGLVLGSFIFGVANAGGEIIWNLWITKFAPSEKVASYMGVHVFLTGVRGIIAPLVAFNMLNVMAITSLAAVAAILIILANVVLINEFAPRALHFFQRADK